VVANATTMIALGLVACPSRGLDAGLGLSGSHEEVAMSVDNEDRESSPILEALHDGLRPAEDEPGIALDASAWVDSPEADLDAVQRELQGMGRERAARATVPTAEPSCLNLACWDPVGEGDAAWGDTGPTGLGELYQQAVDAGGRALPGPPSAVGLASEVGLARRAAGTSPGGGPGSDADEVDRVTFDRTVGQGVPPAAGSAVVQVALPARPGDSGDGASPDADDTPTPVRWSKLP
jgi:hypothetical protein